ncbi:hypothetical protein VTN49DRAFT_4379 [Thermomyces lanuginosus]|uniref:uncharacterized protein n=1 Tax=Thermomyces lanuginosus TaxID=5541 RepID=UPI003743AADF
MGLNLSWFRPVGYIETPLHSLRFQLPVLSHFTSTTIDGRGLEVLVKIIWNTDFVYRFVLPLSVCWRRDYKSQRGQCRWNHFLCGGEPQHHWMYGFIGRGVKFCRLSVKEGSSSLTAFPRAKLEQAVLSSRNTHCPGELGRQCPKVWRLDCPSRDIVIAWRLSGSLCEAIGTSAQWPPATEHCDRLAFVPGTQSYWEISNTMEDFNSTDSDYTSYWRDWFISARGNEYFCEIDEEYLTDRFNLTGLNTEVQYYQYALDLITDVFDLDADDELREQIEKSARHLYGLVHARYIVTTRGLAKMLEKYKRADFGRCPRVLCDQHPLLPMGLSDVPNQKTVKLYCAKCEDIYNPKSSRHASIDGAYFGTSFHNILFQVYPSLVPEKSMKRYEPRVFGFKVHACAALARWQDARREEMRERLNAAGVDCKFIEDSEEEEEELDDDSDEGFDQQGSRRAAQASTRMDTGA